MSPEHPRHVKLSQLRAAANSRQRSYDAQSYRLRGVASSFVAEPTSWESLNS
jgi:hypothetical protein